MSLQESVRDENDFIDATASGRKSPPERGPLDHELERLLRPTDSLHDAINELVPFPKIESPPGARITDISIRASVTSEVVVRVNLTTGISIESAGRFYQQALHGAGVPRQSVVAATSSHVIVRGTTVNRAITDTSFYFALSETDRGTQVELRASYDGFGRSRLVDLHADWHRGWAPVNNATVDAFEVTTAPAVGMPGHVGRYTTRLRLPDQAIGETQMMVEHLLRRDGWTWIEATADELYLDGPFDAEVHLGVDQADTIVDFVGEFPIG